MRRAVLVVLAAGVPAVAGAQASEFAARALGIPVLSTSVRGHGTAGGLALFDPEGSLNPAALAGVFNTTATFNVRQYWRSSENPFGAGSGNDMQFPLASVAGPVGLRWAVGLSVSALTDRTFSVGFRDTVMARDLPVEVHDTLSSRGGLSDLRAAVAYRTGGWLAIGAGVHMVSGLNRMEFRRVFSDAEYAAVRLSHELSALAPGFSVGVLAEPGANLRFAATVRVDGDLRLDLDSLRVATQPMPTTLAGGIAWHPSREIGLSGHLLYRNWSVADENIRERGGVGAVNTTEVAAGIEWFRNRAQPFRFPLRAGVRYAELPFPLVEGRPAREVMVTLGTGVRFSGGRGSVDLALERAWRSDQGSYRERTFMVAIGVGVRP